MCLPRVSSSLLAERLLLQRHAGEVLAPVRKRLARLPVELVRLLRERLRLHLEPLLRGGHVGDAPLHLLEMLELSLVAVVERLTRILGPVEQRGHLRLDHRERASCQSCLHFSSFDFDGRYTHA